jgi:hypothetical protein
MADTTRRKSRVTLPTRACLLVVLAMLTLACACDERAMSQPDAFPVYFRNDLTQPVVLALCHSDRSAGCADPSYSYTVAPGNTEAENISPDVSTEWAIESNTGKLLRCVVLYWKYQPSHDPAVSVSQAPSWANPCPRRTPASRHM